MPPSESRETQALRELDSVHFLHLYADRKLIRQRSYVAAARQLEHRGRLTQWSLIIGAGCLAGRSVLPLITRLDPGGTMDVVLIGVNLGLAVVVAACGMRIRKQTSGVRSRVKSLLSQTPGRSHAS